MLADPTRVRVVMALRAGELSVNTLADLVEKPAAAVSQHLAKMRLSRLVTTRREGTRVYYRLANEHVAQLVSDALFQAEHSVTDQPRHHGTPTTSSDRPAVTAGGDADHPGVATGRPSAHVDHDENTP